MSYKDKHIVYVQLVYKLRNHGNPYQTYNISSNGESKKNAEKVQRRNNHLSGIVRRMQIKRRRNEIYLQHFAAQMIS